MLAPLIDDVLARLVYRVVTARSLRARIHTFKHFQLELHGGESSRNTDPLSRRANTPAQRR
jgi:hypothetical protein